MTTIACTQTVMSRLVVHACQRNAMKHQSIALCCLSAAALTAPMQATAASNETLDFRSVSASTSLSFNDVLGSTQLTITPLAPAAGTSTNLRIQLVDLHSTEGAAWADEAIGVQVFKRTGQGQVTAMDDPTIDKNQGLLFTFSQAVRLTGFNMDHAVGAGASQFTLSVDGGAAQNFRLDGGNWASTGLTGTTFAFGYLNSGGAPYAIDSVSLASLTVSASVGGGVVTAVPEPQTYALMAACLGVLAVATRRRQQT